MKSIVFINFRRLCRLISKVKLRRTVTDRAVFCAEFIIAEGGGKSSSLPGVFRLTPTDGDCQIPSLSRLHALAVRRPLYFRINIFARACPIEIS